MCYRVLVDEPASLSISALRERAAEMRREAEVIRSKADAIEEAIDRLLSVLGEPAPQPTMRISLKAAAIPAAFMSGKPPAEDERSSRYGIITSKWISVLRPLAEAAGYDEFSIPLAIDVVKEVHGKERRAVDIRRQFQPYIDAGYLQEMPDGYKFTTAGFAKIGLSPPIEDQERHAPNENEAPNGNAAGASDVEEAPTSSNESHSGQALFD